MVCSKCGYADIKEVKKGDNSFCQVCASFVPSKKSDIEEYVLDKVDWKKLEPFRKWGSTRGKKQKKGMEKQAKVGFVVTRPPLGYDVVDGHLQSNKDASRVHSLFRTYLNRNYSLNSLSKSFGLSLNGLKKVLTNRTYLGEIKFDGKLHKGSHKPLISAEIFYAVQRKLGE